MSVETRTVKKAILEHVLRTADLQDDAISDVVNALGIASINELICVNLNEIAELAKTGEISRR